MFSLLCATIGYVIPVAIIGRTKQVPYHPYQATVTHSKMSLLIDRCLIAKDPKWLHKIIAQQKLMIPTIWPSIPRQQTGFNSNPVSFYYLSVSFYYLWCWCSTKSSDCWCPGSLQPQVSSSHDIGYIGKAGPFILWGVFRQPASSRLQGLFKLQIYFYVS